MNRMSQLISRFSTKKGNFFWTEVNPNVKEAEYAVRGYVPTMANNIKNDILGGNKSITINIQIIPLTLSPFAISEILKNFIKNPLPFSEKSYHVL